MPFGIIYEVQDDSGDVASTELYVPNTFSLSQYGEFATAFATFLDAFLGGKVIRASICAGADLSGLTGNTADAQADREAKAAFQYKSAAGFNVNLNVPGNWDGQTIAGSDDLDLGSATISPLDALMRNGISVTGGTIIPCDKNESDLVALNYARERYVNSGVRR